MESDVWERLETFAREELGRPLFGGRLDLLPTSRLEEDLGLTGEDAVEFIDKWAETFSVQVRDFPYRRYFRPEGQEMLSGFLGLFSKRYRRPAVVPLTLGMLAEAMQYGRWDTSVIEAAAARGGG
ncbi:DUF1493 family protein [Burkholderia vietnamiensis]|uniref:DUF1493 family protein n=2 Tax=Burkholderiales TaxID=80840 RepID=UPI0005D9EBB5|nr:MULTISPECIES: DUF1493 family protein [Burkholderia]AJY07061.1 hypothetical protein AK36_1237 [Burkholderia vietnamiensis LMG 10929]AOK11003.1 acyl carrier protein [Burkholderia vietnamiensis]AVR16491.1 DUF1493 domain-containing protein [Burkholderia vietnamiensis]KVF07004.1 acyl carrier protein [Burkholderia vietnamiensis]KVF30798.1 acyl carrier protein [Burkholderia vietnamiensis]